MSVEPDPQTEQLDPSAGGATADFQPTHAEPVSVGRDPTDVWPAPAEPSVTEATGAWQAGAEAPAGGATGDWQREGEGPAGTTDFAPSQMSGTSPVTIDEPVSRSGSHAPTHLPSFQGVTGAAPVGAFPPAAPPQVRSGRYVMKKFHAKGGMGEIWLAEDSDIGRSVALKKMRGSPRPDQKDQFLREAQITGQLEHPGVVPVHELGVDDEGQPFYVMMFIQGRTLSDAIDEYHAPPAPGTAPREVQGLRLLQTFITLCQTVAYAHSKGVIHRDIKPDNVMVGAYGETLVLDWGLAKPVGVPDDFEDGQPTVKVQTRFSGESVETLDGAVKGTPAYMAPEVAEGNVSEVDKASDLYLLGGTLYHILTGKKPRKAKKIAELIELARKHPPTPPRKLDRTIPRALEAICLKAMAPRKEDRYASASALAEDMQHYLAGEPVLAYRENVWERAWRWIKRHRVLLMRSAVVLVELGLVLFGANWIRLAEEQRARQAQESARLKQLDQARTDAGQFRALAEEVQRLFALQDPLAERLSASQAENTERKAEQAVAVLRSWGPALADFPLPEQLPALKEQLYEVLLVQAETKSRRGTSRGGAKGTLALLDTAAGLRPPPRSRSGGYRPTVIGCSARRQSRARPGGWPMTAGRRSSLLTITSQLSGCGPSTRMRLRGGKSRAGRRSRSS
jgi:hypothetical protein